MIMNYWVYNSTGSISFPTCSVVRERTRLIQSIEHQIQGLLLGCLCVL